MTPEQESDAPTSIEFNTLGNLISKITLLLISFPEKKMLIISLNGIETLPRDKDITKQMIRITNRPVNIKTFLDNNLLILISIYIQYIKTKLIA